MSFSNPFKAGGPRVWADRSRGLPRSWPGGRACRGLAVAAAVTCAATGCDANADAYVALQNTMKSHITTKDHRPVASVSCTPHLHDTVREQTAHLRCLVVFKNGTSYTANAIIQNENFGGAHNLPDSYSWDSPPAN